MTDITKQYTCRHIFDYEQPNEKEMILKCRNECGVIIRVEIINVTTEL